MAYKRESLEKLIDLVLEISSKPENQWFKDQLSKRLVENSVEIDKIYHSSFESYFILLKKQLKRKANQFYSDISDKNLRNQLAEEYVKMYWHQINNDVKEMFIQAYFQLERMVNFYASSEPSHQKILENPTRYFYSHNTGFSIDCFTNFFKNREQVPIKKITIWPKIVFWALDTANEEFLFKNHTNISHLINIRNENVHKGIPSTPFIDRLLNNYKQADNSIFGFYVNILRTVSGSLDKNMK